MASPDELDAAQHKLMVDMTFPCVVNPILREVSY